MRGRGASVGLLAVLLAAFALPSVALAQPAEIKPEVAWPLQVWSNDQFLRADKEPSWDDRGVELTITVEADGRVSDAVAIRGPEAFRAKARARALTWRYRPYLVSGVATPFRTRAWVSVLGPETKPDATPFPKGPAADATILLTRSGCFFSCAAYSIELRGDGQVTYTGRGYVAVPGVVTYRVDPAEVAALLVQAKEARFFGLKARYEGKITDQATHSVTVTVGGKTKTVEEYVGLDDGMPVSVIMLQRRIDDIAQVRRLVAGTPDTLALLESVGWDFKGDAGARALIGAADQGKADLVAGMVARGAPVTLRLDEARGSHSAIEAVMQSGDVVSARLLEKAGALEVPALRGPALFEAVRSGQLELVQMVMAHHPDINWADPYEGNSLFLLDEAYGDRPRQPLEIAKLLLDAGANPNFRDDRDETPLHELDNPEVIRLLIARGADLEAVNDRGLTPLGASYLEDRALLLMDLGARTDVKNPHGGTFEEWARKQGWTRVLQRLSGS